MVQLAQKLYAGNKTELAVTVKEYVSNEAFFPTYLLFKHFCNSVGNNCL